MVKKNYCLNRFCYILWDIQGELVLADHETYDMETFVSPNVEYVELADDMFVETFDARFLETYLCVYVGNGGVYGMGHFTVGVDDLPVPFGADASLRYMKIREPEQNKIGYCKWILGE